MPLSILVLTSHPRGVEAWTTPQLADYSPLLDICLPLLADRTPLHADFSPLLAD